MDSRNSKSRPEAADDPLVTNSAIYRRFLAEREEILRHKWLKSEQAGKDVGFENALLDWMLKHRTRWHEETASGKDQEKALSS